MKFHEEWQHPNCPVMKWYKIHTQSTTFTSIQHRKDLQAPFFHEFLLIQLTDGSICRIERMGDGSRADAVRWIGCTSHDIIQWFAPGAYASCDLSRQPSELIVEVDCGRRFDLLDVLAICYSVQQHRRTLSYTLQRFNCYFLCSTILAVLSRRVAEWERLISPANWNGMVDSVLDDMQRINSEDTTQYLAVGICSLLDPDSPNPSAFLMDSLRVRLDGDAHANLNQKVASTLWQKDLKGAVESGLSTQMQLATEAALASDTHSSIMLSALLSKVDKERFPHTQLDLSRAQEAMSRQFLSGFCEIYEHITRCNEERYRMEQLEHRRSFSMRFAAAWLAVLSPFWRYPLMLCFPTQLMHNDGVDDYTVIKLCDLFHGTQKSTH